MDTIGLIAAMTQESAALLRYARGWKKTSLGEFKSYQIEIDNLTCILVTSGMGVIRAGAAAQKLIEKISVQYLVSFGIAGAVEASLKIGDVVLVEKVYALRNGTLSPGFPLQLWQQAASDAASRILAERKAQLYRGTAVTTGGSQVTEAQLHGIQHPVLEMETMGIAQVAVDHDIPFFAVRAISDGPVSPIPFDLGEMMDENANLRTGKLLMAMLHHPVMIGELIKMMRNTRIAADHAAITLMELLRYHSANAV